MQLPGGRCLVATGIIANSPAQKSGIKTHDILLEMGERTLDSAAALVQQVRATGKNTMALKLIRGGKQVTVMVTPELRDVEAALPHEASRVWSLMTNTNTGVSNQNWVGHVRPAPRWNMPTAPADKQLEKRLDKLDHDQDALHKAIDDRRNALNPGKAID